MTDESSHHYTQAHATPKLLFVTSQTGKSQPGLFIPTTNPAAWKEDTLSFPAAFKKSSGTYSKSHVTATPTRPASRGPCPSHLTYSQILQQDATTGQEGPGHTLKASKVLQTQTAVSSREKPSKQRIFFCSNLAQNALCLIDGVSFHRK